MTDEVKLNPGLLQPWSRDLVKEVSLKVGTYNPPYVSKFEKDDRQLVCVAAHHPDLHPKNPTFPLIDYAMEKYSPACVIVEGGETGSGGFENLREEAEFHAGNGFKVQDERAYAVHCALTANIPFLAGEPSMETLFSAMNSHGVYNTEELMSFLVLRQLAEGKRMGIVSEANYADYIQTYLSNDRNFGHIPKDQRVTLEKFEDWYKDHNDKPERGFLKVESYELKPVKDGTDFEQMTYAIDEIRKKYEIEIVEKMLEKYHNVMIVYGTAHITTSREMYEAAFGLPEDSTLMDVIDNLKEQLQERERGRHAAAVRSEKEKRGPASSQK